MRSISINELENLVKECEKPLVGSFLQEIRINDRYIALGFFRGQMKWLVFDLHPQVPLVMFFEQNCPIIKSPKPKPIGLFLNSKALNLKLNQISILREFGRVLILSLGHHQTFSGVREDKSICEVEFHLIPKSVNCIVRSEGKKISWNRPRELHSYGGLFGNEEGVHGKNEYGFIDLRNNHEIIEEWQNQVVQAKVSSSSSQPLDPQQVWELQRKKNIEKKKKALQEIELKIKEDPSRIWYELGEKLKSIGHLDGDFQNLKLQNSKMIDPTKDYSWNLQNIFSKARHFKNKKQGTLDRAEILKTEIRNLEEAQYEPQNEEKKQRRFDLLLSAQAQGRKKILTSGAIAYLGKSAADNLRILRSSKAWDYWLHLKDYPSAHGIIHRDRNQKISDSEIIEVAKWLIRESISTSSLLKGQKLIILIAETRYVKPIKGDKLGRVHYHSERTLTCTI